MGRQAHKAIEEFTIEFDRQIYHPGDTVNGRVLLRFRDKMVCNRVSIRFLGLSKVFWVEKAVKAPYGLQNVPYSAETVYFDQTLPLWTEEGLASDDICITSQAEKDEELKSIVEKAQLKIRAGAKLSTASLNRPNLPAGSHQFQFSLLLPQHIPSSFEEFVEPNGFARINYTATVNLSDQGWIKGSRKEKIPVVKPSDLNYFPKAKEAVIVEGIGAKSEKGCIFDLCCCDAREIRENGSLHLMVTLQKSGFLPGDLVPVSAEIENQGRKPKILQLRASVIQRLICQRNKPDAKIRETYINLSTVTQDLTLEGGRAWRWDGDPKVFIPDVVPGFHEPGMMEIEYRISLKLFSKDSRKSKSKSEQPILVTEMPIIIGSIPFSD